MSPYKILKRNDQRNDPPTPIWKTLGWAECMGNTFQNIANWTGACYQEQFGAFSKTNTFSYYAGFETWLNGHGFSPKNKSANKISDLHAKYMNELFRMNGVPLEIIVTRPGSKKMLIEALSEERPCGVGTQITPDGHIITALEYDEKTDLFKTSDSYGNAKTMYKNHDGFGVDYDWDFMNVRALYILNKKEWK